MASQILRESNNQTLTVADMTVRQDDAGRYNLNDFQKASGGDPKDKPSQRLRYDKATDLIDELKVGNHTLDPINSKRGRSGGTFVVKELVYAYAMWISPAFNLKVIRAFDRLQTDGVAVAEMTRYGIEYRNGGVSDVLQFAEPISYGTPHRLG
ncbi:KilA-N domain-containing protein [Halomonas sp.]|uniref:KilA-N domain-containing protein n=1 Tax=Halomonas sp. TaxID=1486246 RepID=UPI00298E43D7|nr:KilA-N domain-containing protein [Halomonas sp.]MDW7747023.1 KilA-N domain-containing protein [Halomonas sp.]